MPLVLFEKVSLAFGDHPVLDSVSWKLESKERVALIGRNGTGKSTMLKLLTMEQLPDSGRLIKDPSTSVAALPQDLPEADEQSVYEVVAKGLNSLGQALKEYHQLAHAEIPDLDQLARIQNEIDSVNGWAIETKIKQILTRLQLNPEQKMRDLSGGWRRRVLLAQALVTEPDVLLLDEPTNHLDVEAIQWLEEFLNDYQGAVVLITHDRALLNRVANRIIELDRGNLTEFVGTYEAFLELKQKLLEDEAVENERFDKKLAKEEVWIRQGIKARRTRNEGRVRALKALREERSQRREVQGKANFELQQGHQSGKLVFELEDFGFAFGDKVIVSGFTGQVMRKDRIALLGPNGVGKSTLIKLMLGQLQGGTGQLKGGTNIEVAYFDQLRDQLDGEKSVMDNLAQGREFVEINGQRRHVISYLEDFLFSPDRTRQPVKALSGGEANRLMLAKLFSKPANLLVLDEPTNDLDVETLELLELLLAQFDGTVLLVSHDRTFIDNVATQSWYFAGEGRIEQYVGGWADMEWQRANQASMSDASQSKPKEKKVDKPKKKAVKLSYKVQREYDELPGNIEAGEARLAQLQQVSNEADFYARDVEAQQAHFAELESQQAKLDAMMERWMEIEMMIEELQN